jgi:copper(I)-binding protein
VRWLLGVLCLSSLPAWGQVTIENPWARATAPNAKLGAGYLTVTNAGAADRIVGASSAAAARVELHVNIKDGDVLRMREVKELKVPAKGRLELKPSGSHLMFVDIRQPFRQGEKVPLTLRFEKAGEVKVELPVTRSAPAPEHQHHKH